MKKIFNLYLLFWKMEIQKQLMYRPLMSMFSFLAHAFYIVATFVMLTVVSANLSSKIQQELFLYLSFFHTVKGIFWIYASQSSGFLAGSAFREGKIDYFLIRPVNNQWAISSFKPNVFAFTDLLVGVSSFLYFAGKLNLVNPYFVGLYVLLSILGAIILYSVWFSYLTFLVPAGEASAAHSVMNLFWSFGQYPNRIYSGLTKIISVAIFPTLVITTYPVTILLSQSPIELTIFLVLFALFGLAFSSRLWNRMLRFYTSAN